MAQEYRCTRNAPYEHECLGQLDLRERQGHYVWAECEEAAWGKMAVKFPEEVRAGFTVQKWEGFNVRIGEARQSKNYSIKLSPEHN
jgi:hypothetical protein